MNQRIICKTLAVAVIILFFGLAIQPSVADAIDIIESEEQCDICPSVKDLVDSEEIEKYQELLDKINSYKERNKELDTDRGNQIICDILDILLLPMDILFELIYLLQDFYFISLFLASLVLIGIIPMGIIIVIAYGFGCF